MTLFCFYFEQPPVYYLVTELLDTDLSTFLKTEKDLSLFQRLKLSRGVCLGSENFLFLTLSFPFFLLPFLLI